MVNKASYDGQDDMHLFVTADRQCWTRPLFRVYLPRNRRFPCEPTTRQETAYHYMYTLAEKISSSTSVFCLDFPLLAKAKARHGLFVSN